MVSKPVILLQCLLVPCLSLGLKGDLGTVDERLVSSVSYAPSKAAEALAELAQEEEPIRSPPSKVLFQEEVIYRPRGDPAPLLIAEESRPRTKRGQQGRRRSHHSSYHYDSPPRRNRYSHSSGSDSGNHGDGGYSDSSSFSGNGGFNTYHDYNRANSDSFGDSNHVSTEDDEEAYGGLSRGHQHPFSSVYGDDGKSYLRPGLR